MAGLCVTAKSGARLPLRVIHVALVASVNRPHVRFASESDRIAAQQRNDAQCPEPVIAIGWSVARLGMQDWHDLWLRSWGRLAHRSSKVAKMFNEALDHWAHRSILKGHNVDRPRPQRQIDRQYFERLEVRYRPRHRGNEFAVGKEMGNDRNG